MADFVSAFGVKKEVQPTTRRDTQMMAALGTDTLARIEIGRIQHSIARGALDPKALGNLFAACGLALNPGWQQLV
jgi:hypothetical protein